MSTARDSGHAPSIPSAPGAHDWLVPFLGALFVLATSVLLVWLIGIDGSRGEVGIQEVAREDPAFQSAALSWAASALMLFCALAVALALSWCVARDALGKERARWLWIGTGLAAALFLGVRMSELVILPGALHGLVEGLPAGVKTTREILKGASAAAIFGLVTAIASTLAPCQGPEQVASQLSRLRLLLYAIGALLASGVFEISRLLAWPLVKEDAATSAFHQLATATTTAAGLVFTLLIVATYGSATFLLYKRVRRLEPRTVEEGKQDWLASHGFDSSFVQHTARLLAMLAPFVVGGPLSTIVDWLKG